jgi:hypothetical protein
MAMSRSTFIAPPSPDDVLRNRAKGRNSLARHFHGLSWSEIHIKVIDNSIERIKATMRKKRGFPAI